VTSFIATLAESFFAILTLADWDTMFSCKPDCEARLRLGGGLGGFSWHVSPDLFLCLDTLYKALYGILH
jgi:hypothetical protein